MKQVLLLTESELRKYVLLDIDAINCVENAFKLLATSRVVMPAVLRMDIPESNGEVDVKTAYLPSLNSFAIKISPGFFDNPKIGLPSLNGLMVLLCAKTGVLESILLDNGWLTALRTAAAGAVASRWLSNDKPSNVTIIGAGEQARLQLLAIALVRKIKSVNVWAKDFNNAQQYAQIMSPQIGIEIKACQSVDIAMQDTDIAVTATPSTIPLIKRKHLKTGLHITAMGSDAEHKNELHPEVLKHTDLYVCDSLKQTRVMGELHHAITANLFSDTDIFPELGQIIAGQVIARTSNDDITVCDLTGTGVQDTAIANMAYQKSLHLGFGSKLHI